MALTHGIHTRIDETVAAILARVRAGNVYVNRNIVGAVVGVQPFGGHGLSGTGPKAGGPLYLRRLVRGARRRAPIGRRSRCRARPANRTRWNSIRAASSHASPPTKARSPRRRGRRSRSATRCCCCATRPLARARGPRRRAHRRRRRARSRRRRRACCSTSTENDARRVRGVFAAVARRDRPDRRSRMRTGDTTGRGSSSSARSPSTRRRRAAMPRCCRSSEDRAVAESTQSRVRYFDAAAIRSRLPWPRMLAALDAMLQTDVAAPLRTSHAIEVPGEPNASLLLMPAWRSGGRLGVKLVTVFPGNARRNERAVGAVYALFDARNGAPLALFDGEEITARRTAGASAYAASHLARVDARHLRAGRIRAPRARTCRGAPYRSTDRAREPLEPHAGERAGSRRGDGGRRIAGYGRRRSRIRGARRRHRLLRDAVDGAARARCMACAGRAPRPRRGVQCTHARDRRRGDGPRRPHRRRQPHRGARRGRRPRPGDDERSDRRGRHRRRARRSRARHAPGAHARRRGHRVQIGAVSRSRISPRPRPCSTPRPEAPELAPHAVRDARAGCRSS